MLQPTPTMLLNLVQEAPPVAGWSCIVIGFCRVYIDCRVAFLFGTYFTHCRHSRAFLAVNDLQAIVGDLADDILLPMLSH